MKICADIALAGGMKMSTRAKSGWLVGEGRRSRRRKERRGWRWRLNMVGKRGRPDLLPVVAAVNALSAWFRMVVFFRRILEATAAAPECYFL